MIAEKKGDRKIEIVLREDGSIEVEANGIFIAREMHKIRRSLDQWYRVSRRNVRVQENVRNQNARTREESRRTNSEGEGVAGKAGTAANTVK